LIKGGAGRDLLKESIIVQASAKSGWHNVNLEMYLIPVLKIGCFVCMEWVFSGDQYYYSIALPAEGGKEQMYGQTLANVLLILRKEQLG